MRPLALLLACALPAIGRPADPPVVRASEAAAQPDFKGVEEERTDRYASQLERYLRDYIVDEYPRRATAAWQCHTASLDAFLKSVEPNRTRWRAVIKPPSLVRTGPLERAPADPLADVGAQWWRVPLGSLAAEGIIAVPTRATRACPVPLVIVQHGIGSYPERTFGFMDDGGAYHAYARELLVAGFAVLAPMNLRSVERRNRIERLCRLADVTLPGIELVRLQRLLDMLDAEPRVDRERIALWGISLGGMATMFWTPLEPRIKAAICSAWFNHRRNKMAVPDPRYSCFLETKEEHAFLKAGSRSSPMPTWSTSSARARSRCRRVRRTGSRTGRWCSRSSRPHARATAGSGWAIASRSTCATADTKHTSRAGSASSNDGSPRREARPSIGA